MVAKQSVKIIDSQFLTKTSNGAFIDMIMNVAAKSSYLNEGHKGAQPAE